MPIAKSLRISILTSAVAALALVGGCGKQPSARIKPEQVDAQAAAMVSKPAAAAPVSAVLEPPPPPPAKRAPDTMIVIGDSFAVGVGMTLAQDLKPYPHISLIQRGKISSGLNSPKFYDWESELQRLIAAKKPDMLVVMIGGNDAHNGKGDQDWGQQYKLRCESFLRIAKEHDLPVYWSGLPPMGDKGFSARIKVANQAMKDACDASGNCRYVDCWELFTDDKGEFTCQKKLSDGKTVTTRAKDGVHFTMNGYRLLSSRIIETIDDDFSLQP